MKKQEKQAEKKLIKMMKIGLGMRLNKKTSLEIEEDATQQRLLISELNKL